MIDLLPHLPSLKRYALALTRSPDRADDLVQDTLTRAIAKQHLFEPGTDLGAWLRTMMHHGYVNGIRSAVRRQAVVHHGDAYGSWVIQRNDAASRTVNKIHLCAPRSGAQYACVFLNEIAKAMGFLPAGQRETLRLLSQGEAREDIARRMGVPLNTVRSRARLARRVLRRLSA